MKERSEMNEVYRCVLVEDNELDQIIFKEYVSHFPEIELVKIFSSAKNIVNEIQSLQPDIVFMDVDIPEMSGLELRKQLEEIPICIFATDHPEYALESFELDTLDYLLKPYSFKRFSQTIERIKDYMTVLRLATLGKGADNVFFFKVGHENVKINLDEVLYLNALQNYTALIAQHEKNYLLSTLKNVLANPKFHSFVRVHKSFAVNKNKVLRFDTNTVHLKGNHQIPVGKSFKISTKDFEKGGFS